MDNPFFDGALLVRDGDLCCWNGSGWSIYRHLQRDLMNNGLYQEKLDGFELVGFVTWSNPPTWTPL